MIAKILLGLAFIYPLVVEGCQDEKLMPCLSTHEEYFTSDEDEEKDKEKFASNDEDPNFCKSLLMDENT